MSSSFTCATRYFISCSVLLIISFPLRSDYIKTNSNWEMAHVPVECWGKHIALPYLSPRRKYIFPSRVWHIKLCIDELWSVRARGVFRLRFRESFPKTKKKCWKAFSAFQNESFQTPLAASQEWLLDVILNKSVELTKHSLGIMCIYSAVREELLETRKSFSDFALESLSRILNLFPFRFFFFLLDPEKRIFRTRLRGKNFHTFT